MCFYTNYEYITLLASLKYFWRGSRDPKDPLDPPLLTIESDYRANWLKVYSCYIYLASTNYNLPQRSFGIASQPLLICLLKPLNNAEALHIGSLTSRQYYTELSETPHGHLE